MSKPIWPENESESWEERLHFLRNDFANAHSIQCIHVNWLRIRATRKVMCIFDHYSTGSAARLLKLKLSLLLFFSSKPLQKKFANVCPEGFLLQLFFRASIIALSDYFITVLNNALQGLLMEWDREALLCKSRGRNLTQRSP